MHLWAEVSRIVAGKSHQQTVAEELKKEKTDPPCIYLSPTPRHPDLEGPASAATASAVNPRTHLEVSGVYAELVSMQITESRQRIRQVVQVVGSESQCVCHLLAMGFNLARAGAQVQVCEVGFGGGEGHEGPVGRLSWVHYRPGGVESPPLPLRPLKGELEDGRLGPYLSKASVV